MNFKNYRKDIEYKAKVRKAFISLMRNFNNFNNINNDDIVGADEYAKMIKEYYAGKSISYILFKYMEYIYKKLYNYENKDFLILLLIRTFDKELELYRIYQLECTEKRIKMNSLATLGFYEKELIKYEKAYIKKFLDMDEFDFTKKLEP